MPFSVSHILKELPPEAQPAHLAPGRPRPVRAADPRLVALDRRRAAEARTKAALGQTEAQIIGSMLGRMRDGIAAAKEELAVLRDKHEVGSTRALFHRSRDAYHADVERAKRRITQNLQSGFAAYNGYQEHYGLGDPDNDGEAAADVSSRAVRLALHTVINGTRAELAEAYAAIDPVRIRTVEEARASTSQVEALGHSLDSLDFRTQTAHDALTSLSDSYHRTLRGSGSQLSALASLDGALSGMRAQHAPTSVHNFHRNVTDLPIWFSRLGI